MLLFIFRWILCDILKSLRVYVLSSQALIAQTAPAGVTFSSPTLDVLPVAGFHNITASPPPSPPARTTPLTREWRSELLTQFAEEGASTGSAGTRDVSRRERRHGYLWSPRVSWTLSTTRLLVS